MDARICERARTTGDCSFTHDWIQLDRGAEYVPMKRKGHVDVAQRPITERITEGELIDLLTGPTSFGNARRLAAYAFGHGPEYDERHTA